MATQVIEPPVIERKETVMVRPFQPTPSPILSLSTIDNDPNLELICQTIYVYPSINANDPNNLNQLDPVSVIREGLSKALVHYYPLAGRLKRDNDGKLQLTCTGEGVPFSSASANCTLSSLNYFNGVSIDTAKLFVFKFESDSEHGSHLLMVQVTRFICGGFTIGMGLSHSICDGIGSAQFFRALAELAGGMIEPSVKPVWERERLVAASIQEPIEFPFDEASYATSPYLPSTELVHESFDVTSECIRKLKSNLGKEGDCLTTLEVLGAYVWRSKFRALRMNSDGKTQFSLTIGIRTVVEPPLPEGYYGNAFVGSPVVLEGKELLEWPLSRIAWLIKDSKRRATGVEYVWNFLGVIEKINKENKRMDAKGALTIITDWRHIGLMDMDFGWKQPVNIVPVPWSMFGYVDVCIFLPPFGSDASMKGGVRVLVCLPRDAMAKFKEEMSAMNHEGDKPPLSERANGMV